MDQLQFIRNQGIIALPLARGDRFVGLEGELPLLPHLIRHSVASKSSTCDNPVKSLLRETEVFNDDARLESLFGC